MLEYSCGFVKYVCKLWLDTKLQMMYFTIPSTDNFPIFNRASICFPRNLDIYILIGFSYL